VYAVATQAIPLSEDVRFGHTLAVGCRFSGDALGPTQTSVLLTIDGVSHRRVGPDLTLQANIRQTTVTKALQVLVYPDFGQPKQLGWYSISDGSHNLVLSVVRASKPELEDGSLTVWVDGQKLPPLDNIGMFWRHFPTALVVMKDFIELESVVQTMNTRYLGPALRRHRRPRRK
jgi:hypothetical protein